MLDIKRFVLRLPEETHGQLILWAREDGRSLHGQIIWIIRQALKGRTA